MSDPISIRPTFTRHDYAKRRRDKLLDFEREYVPIPVDEILHSRFEDFDELRELQLANAPKTRTYDSIEVVRSKFAKFVLLGDPGAGKSTLLRKVEISELKRFLDGETSRLPLWIDLGVGDNPSEPRELLMAWWRRHRITDDLDAEINSSSLLLLLDGLNELPGEQDKRAEALRQFLLRYDLPAILTCRVANYHDMLRVGRPMERTGERPIAEVRVPSLDEAQVERFANKKLGSGANDFMEAVYGAGGSAERRALAENPYALTMMLKLWGDPQYAFPHTREQLYDTYIRYLYRENQKRPEPIRAVTVFDALKGRLQALAYQMLLSGGTTTVKREWAEEQVKAEGVSGVTIITDAVNLHLLIANDGEEVRFFHPSLYEHLALPMIDLEKGSVDEREKLIKTLGNLGAAARLALGKLATAYGNVLDAEADDLAAETLEALAKIAHGVARNEPVDSDVRRAAIRLILGGFGLWTGTILRFIDSKTGFARARARALDRALARARDHDLALARDLALALDHALDRALDLATAIAPHLAHDLAGIQKTMPDPSAARGRDAWVAQLRQAMIQHRDIGHDWQLSTGQQEQLRDYITANKLLVDCMNESTSLTQAVREKIENEMLLPIVSLPAGD
jgi:predicted ATPase